MKEEKIAVEQRFYQSCADILGAAYSYNPFPYPKRTRWNNRSAGNGRFPGFGLVRMFGSAVHVQLRAPLAVNRRFPDPDSALAFLTNLSKSAAGARAVGADAEVSGALPI
jgi:hypothetical protein